MIWESSSPDTPRRLLSGPNFLFGGMDVNNPYLTKGGNKCPPGEDPGTYEGLELVPGEVVSPEARVGARAAQSPPVLFFSGRCRS